MYIHTHIVFTGLACSRIVLVLGFARAILSDYWHMLLREVVVRDPNLVEHIVYNLKRTI